MTYREVLVVLDYSRSPAPAPGSWSTWPAEDRRRSPAPVSSLNRPVSQGNAGNPVRSKPF